MEETEDARIKKIKFRNKGTNMEFKKESDVKKVRDAAMHVTMLMIQNT